MVGSRILGCVRAYAPATPQNPDTFTENPKDPGP
jgi:hypothetical protein